MPSFAPPSESANGKFSSGLLSLKSIIPFISTQGFKPSSMGSNMVNFNVGTEFMATCVSNQEAMSPEEP